MSTNKRPTLKLHYVTRTKTVSGELISRHDIETGIVLPHRINRRATVAHSYGLKTVRAIGYAYGDNVPKQTIALSVSDGMRVLASWRLMDNGMGFTGTSEIPMLVADAMRGRETFGQYLNRRAAQDN